MVRLAAALALLAAAPALAADPPSPPLRGDILPGVGRDAVRAAAQQLLRARDLAERGKDAEALDAFVRLLEANGDQLLPWFLAHRPVKEVLDLLGKEGDAATAGVPADERHLVPARWLCHRGIAALPAKTLAAYRDRADEPARQLLDEAVRRRDPRLLRRVVEEAFCSRPAEAALVLLGDLAQADGDPALALHFWLAVAPPGDATPRDTLAYPDPKGDLAAVRARQLVARLRLGEAEAVRAALPAFRKQHPDDTGRLAGRDGKYADIVQALAAAGTPPPADEAWTSFAGGPARSGVGGRLPRYWPAAPEFRVPLPAESPRRALKGGPHAPPEEPPAAPLAAARRLAFHPVVWRDYLLVADATTVRAFDRRTGRAWTVYEMDPPPPDTERTLPARAGLRYTLTVADDRVYVRVGVQALHAPAANEKRGALDSAIVCLGPPTRPVPNGPPLEKFWELTPDKREERSPSVFEGTPVVRDDRLYVAITRFDGRGSVTSVACYGPLTGREPPEAIWRAPTDVATSAGGPGEEVRYRHDLLTLAGPNVVHVTHTGAVVAVDAATGRRAWAHLYPHRPDRIADGSPSPRDLAPAVYAAGRVFVAPADTDRVLALDAFTGERLWEVSGVEPVQLLGVTRGRLIATLAAFPAGIRAWDAGTGEVRWSQPDDGPNGVPTFGRGFLSDALVFWPTARGLHVLSADDGSVVQRPAGPDRWGNLVSSDGTLAAAGDRELFWFNAEAVSLEERRAAVEANPDDPAARYRLALAEADAGRRADAVADFSAVEKAAGRDTLDGIPLRRLALQRRWELLREAGDKSAAGGEFPAAWRADALAHAGAWRDILADADLRDAWLTGPDGRPRTAGSLARAGLGEPAGRAEVERLDRAGKPAEALRACRFALREAGASRAGLLADLGRLLERQGQPAAARSAWRRAQGAGYDKTAAARELARLRPPERPPGADWPDLREPLRQAAEVPLAPFGEWPLATAPGDGVPAAEVLLFRRGDELVARRSDTGVVAWVARLPFAPTWGVPHGDLFVVASEGGAAAVEAGDGRVAWSFTPPIPVRALRPLIPEAGPRLAGFVLCDGRVYAVETGQALLCLDADAGAVLWRREVPALAESLGNGARLNPNYLATPDYVVAQTAPGRRWVLDAFTGAVLHAADVSPVPWSAPPVSADGLRAVVSEPEAVLALDLASGRVLWRFTLERWTGLLNEPPPAAIVGGLVVFVVGRNHGYELDAVDLLTGRRAWAESAFVGRDRPDLSAAALTREAATLTFPGRLISVRLSDGRRLWSRPLPTGEWKCEPTRSGEVLVTPAEATPARDMKAAWRWALGQLRAVPTANRLGRVAGGLYDAWKDRRIVWWLADAKDGREVRRYELPADGPAAWVRAGDGRAWVARRGGLVVFRAGR